MIHYLCAKIGIAAGVGTFSVGIYTGNPVLVQSGALSILGSIGNFISQWSKKETGDEKYIEGAKLVMLWAENNVSQENGAWTVIKNPKSFFYSKQCTP